MKNTVFREYDIRGIVGTEFFVDQVYALTQAMIVYFKEQNPHIKALAVGMDGRVDSLQIKHEMCRALIDAGIAVTDIGLCASGMLYFALHTLPVDGGLMITASHNPKEYNGIKVCLGTESVWGPQLQIIKNYYLEKRLAVSEQKGSVSDYSILFKYVSWLKNQFPHLIGIDLSMVFDCGNGVAGVAMPEIIKEFGWKRCRLLYADVDGTFPNHEADPVVEKNMLDVRYVLETTDAQLGIGFDGDADRMDAMTKEGELLTGDMLLALFAQPILKAHPGSGVVCNVLASSGFLDLISSWGGVVHMVPAGHSNVKDCMKKNGSLVGGESSCHFFFADKHFGYDDALYAALRLIEAIVLSGESLSSLVSMIPRKISSREYRISCPASVALEIIAAVKHYFSSDLQAHILAIDGVRVTMPYGWGIVRKSNTQELVSLRFESETKEGFARIKQDFVGIIKQYIDVSLLAEIDV